MKLSVWILVILSSVLWCATVNAEDTAAIEAGKVLARVGDQEITVEEFQVSLEYRVTAVEEAQGQRITPDAQFRADTLNEMIDARILKMLAKNEGVTADDAAVVAEYDAGVARLGGVEAMPAYLKEMKLTEEGLKEEIRERLIMEKYIDQLTEKLEVTEEETLERYENLKKAGQMERRKPTVDFGYVMARTNGQGAGDFAEAKGRMFKAQERLKAGEAVEKVAEEMSDDGLLGMNKGVYREMDPATGMIQTTAEQLNAMKPGEVTEPFMTGDGWHVIKLIQRNEPGTIELERVREVLEAMIFEEKKAKLLREVVEKAKLVVRVEVMKD